MLVFLVFKYKLHLLSKFSACHPIKSIRDIGGLIPVWVKPAGVVAGTQWSLLEVEGHLRNPEPFK